MDDQTRIEILKTIPYGFYVTGVVGSDGEINGFTTCRVSQVSFEPQQVVVAVRKDQHTHDLFEQGGVFSLNFLDTEQEDLARIFTQPLQPENGTLAGSPYCTGETGPHSSRRLSPTWSAGWSVSWRPGTIRSTSGRSPPHTSGVPPISLPTSTPPWSTEDN
jgi:Flavin reductase like domain